MLRKLRAAAARMTLRVATPGGTLHGFANDALFNAVTGGKGQPDLRLLRLHNHHVGLRLQARFGLPHTVEPVRTVSAVTPETAFSSPGQALRL